MRSVLELLDEQLRLSFEGGAWHGPSVEEALRGVTAQEAASRPIPGAHSIWELVLHLSGAYGLVLRRIDGDTRQLTPLEDWPTVPEATEVNWRRACDDLRSNNRRMRSALLQFPEDRLDLPLIADPPYTAFVQFIGITQHDLYHAGQIVLLRRALGRRE